MGPLFSFQLKKYIEPGSNQILDWKRKCKDQKTQLDQFNPVKFTSPTRFQHTDGALPPVPLKIRLIISFLLWFLMAIFSFYPPMLLFLFLSFALSLISLLSLISSSSMPPRYHCPVTLLQPVPPCKGCLCLLILPRLLLLFQSSFSFLLLLSSIPNPLGTGSTNLYQCW